MLLGKAIQRIHQYLDAYIPGEDRPIAWHIKLGDRLYVVRPDIKAFVDQYSVEIAKEYMVLRARHRHKPYHTANSDARLALTRVLDTRPEIYAQAVRAIKTQFNLSD